MDNRNYDVSIGEDVVSINSLSKSFHVSTPILADINFNIPRGQCMALVGANGAGKSTLIKMILGLVKPSSGNISVLGESPGSKKVNSRIGYLPELAGYWGELSAQELLSSLGKLNRLSESTLKTRSEKLFNLMGLSLRSSRRMGGYSKGMLQRAGIAASLLKDPEIWILDEPMSGLDPRAQEKFRELIKKLKQEGKTIIISSHSLDDIRMLCDRVIVLEKSRLLVDGETTEVVKQLVEKYRSSEPWDEDPLGEFGEDWKL